MQPMCDTLWSYHPDLPEQLIMPDGTRHRLPPMAAALLERLLQSPGRVVSLADLEATLDAALGGDFTTVQSVYDALKPLRAVGLQIRNLPGRGYVFQPPQLLGEPDPT